MAHADPKPAGGRIARIRMVSYISLRFIAIDYKTRAGRRMNTWRGYIVQCGVRRFFVSNTLATS